MPGIRRTDEPSIRRPSTREQVRGVQTIALTVPLTDAGGDAIAT